MSMRVRVLLSLVVVTATLLLAHCGHYTCGATFGNSSCSASGSGLGVNGGGSTISAGNAAMLVYFGDGLEAAGFGGSSFASLASYTAPTLSGNAADQMTIVNKTFLYVPTGGTTIGAFNITRSSGALTPITGSPFTVSGAFGTADGAWSDPKGRFLFVGSEGGANIWSFTIDQTTGALTPTPGIGVFTGLSSADIMTVDASGKYLYVGQGFSSSGVAAFSINQNTGDLTPIPGSPFNLGVAQIHASLTGEFLLGVQQIQDAGSATDQHIYVFSINPNTGVPTAVTGSPFATASAPLDFAISPNGNFVYTFGTSVGGGTLGPIEGFQIDSTTGALTSLSGSPFGGLSTTSGCYFDQSGAYMACIDLLFGQKMFVLGASTSTGALTNAASNSVDVNFPFAVTD